MKTILVPTDFSEVAENATEYAVELAKLSKAHIVLLHAYHMPIVTTEVPVVMPSQNELEADTLLGLRKVEARLKEKHGQELNISCIARYGLAADEIISYESESPVDLIVMGMRGAGIIAEKLIGSVTTSLISKVKKPVLVIDRHIHYRLISRIVLACDYSEFKSDRTLEPLKEIAKLFHAEIQVLNVIREPAELVPTTEQAVVGVKLEHSLEEIDHSFHYTENHDVVDGINDYVEKHGVDLVAMVPHAHSIFSKLFQEPWTKKMAFHTNVPLLLLNE